MSLSQLKTAQLEINKALVSQFKADNFIIREMAENMAECATNIQGQGYTSFTTSRDAFLKRLDDMLVQYAHYLSVEDKNNNY